MKKDMVNEERTRILAEMSACDPADERYEVLEKRLNQLPEKKSKLDINGIIQAAIKTSGPIILGAVIIAFEKAGGAFVSQASKMCKF